LVALVDPSHREAEQLFRGIYDAHAGALHRYVSRLIGDVSAADDVTQDAFASLWKELAAGRQPSNPRAWLYKAATNRVINRYHARRRTLSVITTGDLTEADHADRAAGDLERAVAVRDIVRRALDTLPEPMRQVFLLHHEGLAGKEIAEIVGVKTSYVGTLVLRAHERFRRACDALGGRDGMSR
jgi:RNA polymerase sigma-70 factor (ECF subfamily)